MRLATSLFVLSTVLTYIDARPAGGHSSLLHAPADVLERMPEGKTPLSRSDMTEMARMAHLVNHAYCIGEHGSAPSGSALKFQPETYRKARRLADGTRIVKTSRDELFADVLDEVEMDWYIAHTPSTQTLSLVFSSMPSVEETLEMFMEDVPVGVSQAEAHLTPLPDLLFPAEHQPHWPHPQIHHAYVPAVETHATAAVLSLLELLESPPSAERTNAEILRGFLMSLSPSPAPTSSTGPESRPPTVIKRVEVIGHGLGAAVGLLSAMSLYLELQHTSPDAYARPLPKVDITTTMFSAPRVGDHTFANWVDSLTLADPSFQVHRITSYADSLVHLPGRHMEMQHPSLGEIWVDQNAKTAYSCKPEEQGLESHACSNSIPLGQTDLRDHAGPFAGVYIGPGQCGRRGDDGL